MRSSKSNPSKYVRHYRSISQRQMTKHESGNKGDNNNDDNDIDQKEIERLRMILRESKDHIDSHHGSTTAITTTSSLDRNNNNDKNVHHDDDKDVLPVVEPTIDYRFVTANANFKKSKSHSVIISGSDPDSVDDHDSENKKDSKKKRKLVTSNAVVDDENQQQILSPELLIEEDSKVYDSNNSNALIITKKKKRNDNDITTTSTKIELTVVEMKQAKQLYKSNTKKLIQLEKRQLQKLNRNKVYEQLNESSLNIHEQLLLRKSSQLSGYSSKKIILQKLIHKEKLGIPLTSIEYDLLYQRNNKKMKTLMDDNDDDDDDDDNDEDDDDKEEEQDEEDDEKVAQSETVFNKCDHQENEFKSIEPTNDDTVATQLSRRQKKHEKKKKQRNDSSMHDVDQSDNESQKQKLHPSELRKEKEEKMDQHETNQDKNVSTDGDTEPNSTKMSSSSSSSSTKTNGLSFAAQMMSSLSQLKSKCDNDNQDKKQTQKHDEVEEFQRQIEEDFKMKYNNTATNNNKPYITQEPIEIKTTQSYDIILPKKVASSTSTTNDRHNNNNINEKKNHNNSSHKKVMVREINHPVDIKQSRYDLPINEMEYEIIDAIKHHDVSIICAETGSGKSTQVPQMLYESYFSHSKSECTKNDANNDNAKTVVQQSLIGITQPRRVAAISTAKRVNYEMGFSKANNTNNAITNTNNVVSYQTRYESAGLGSDTHIKFMTDGILLQEIQNDLLLRKYSIIILDEAHERNLNTDCLIGLLSVTIPLRKQAAIEEAEEAIKVSSEQQKEKHQNKQNGQQQVNPPVLLQPLKIVIMSATLRIEDFTSNKNLFSSSHNTNITLVKVPGRTHPVTVHHNKVTELDDYEEAVFRKTCKIHRQLPAGGILVFLTGKQEIIRMVNRLRHAFANKSRNSNREYMILHDDNKNSHQKQQQPQSDVDDYTLLRDLDDDEADDEIFRSDDNEELQKNNIEKQQNDDQLETNNDQNENEDNDDDGIPKNVIILPLYSLLSPIEQAKVFDTVPEGYRLIIVATNIAETSITIPDIKYVVDSGRQKCRNYNSSTGVASYDIVWISKAAADQRAGRAGRTGPGHCYRLYSSSMYSRHMDPYALPEVLTRPLEDVVLAMKAMKISNISNFPFPTPPDKRQIDAALNLLANIGCVDLSLAEKNQDDGVITRLGAAVAQLPLGVRCGKILLVAAQAGVLDFAIVLVAAMSEQSPFIRSGHIQLKNEEDDAEANEEDSETENSTAADKTNLRWVHKCGDLLATLHAVGAYTYAGYNAGSINDQRIAYRAFCETNGLNHVIMDRIQKLRTHLCRLAKTRLSDAGGVAASNGGFVQSMKPPNKVQEQLLCQSIASGLLDNIALLAPLGSISGERPYSLRSAYLSCSSHIKEPLFIDRNSCIYSRDPRLLPKWICYESITRKKLKDGTPIAVMKNITPIESVWLGPIGKTSRLLTMGEPIPSPVPMYDPDNDSMMCSVVTKFGNHGWEIPPIRVNMYDALQTADGMKNTHFMSDDTVRWFARYLLEGKVISEMKQLETMYNDSPTLITRSCPMKKVSLLVSTLGNAGVDNMKSLKKQWYKMRHKFIGDILLQHWVKQERQDEFKTLWMKIVKNVCSST